MLLISFEYLLFLALVLSVFYLCKKRDRWTVLLFASIAFYAFSGIFSLIYVLVVSLSSYGFALIMQKCRKEGSDFCFFLCFYTALTLIVGMWMLSRYLGRVSAGTLRQGSILGISFYSLRVISYIIEVKRGKLNAEKNILKYFLFVAFFPIATLGPIASYDGMSSSLFSGEGSSFKGFLYGGIRLLWGAFKKCVIANLLSEPLARIYENPDTFSGAYVLFLLVFYSAEIYCDFSGGIDMAIGTAEMFGIGLPENFDRPFSSRSVGEFWKKWHITLGEWFERYVFYPVSLSKPMQKLSKFCRRRFGVKAGKRIPVYLATVLTWLSTGLWHGGEWHFVAWGLINGVLVIISRELSAPIEGFYIRHAKLKRDNALLCAIGRTRVFLIIGAVRLLDVYRSFPLTLRMLGTVFFDIQSIKGLLGGAVTELISLPLLITVGISLMLVLVVSESGVRGRKIAEKPTLSAAVIFFLLIIILVFGGYSQGYDSSDFIYSRY